MFHKNLKNNIHQRCHCPISSLSFNNISEEERNNSLTWITNDFHFKKNKQLRNLKVPALQILGK